MLFVNVIETNFIIILSIAASVWYNGVSVWIKCDVISKRTPRDHRLSNCNHYTLQLTKYHKHPTSLYSNEKEKKKNHEMYSLRGNSFTNRTIKMFRSTYFTINVDKQFFKRTFS